MPSAETESVVPPVTDAVDGVTVITDNELSYANCFALVLISTADTA
jgi:hypothetical protein